jgi:hypothetical protein
LASIDAVALRAASALLGRRPRSPTANDPRHMRFIARALQFVATRCDSVCAAPTVHSSHRKTHPVTPQEPTIMFTNRLTSAARFAAAAAPAPRI